jgi:hypothetical protein
VAAVAGSPTPDVTTMMAVLSQPRDASTSTLCHTSVLVSVASPGTGAGQVQFVEDMVLVSPASSAVFVARHCRVRSVSGAVCPWVAGLRLATHARACSAPLARPRSLQWT